jgi:hypothetical protein
MPAVQFNSRVVSEKAIFPGAFLVACGIFFFISWRQAFHVTYNDFWGILFYARQLSWQEKASLYNGFFPIGYALLLRLLPYGLVIQGITAINLLFGGLLSATVTQLARKTGSSWIILLVFGISISYPLVVEYATSVPPEIGSAGFTAAAIFLLWDKVDTPPEKTRSLLRFILAGAFLGLATLWRNHTIVSSIAILTAYLITVRETPVKGKISLLAGFLALFSVQVGVNLISGHGLLETAQNFNLYKLFNLVDWRNMPRPEEVAAFSLVKTFLSAPETVLAVYLPALFKILIYALPASLGWLCFPKSGQRRFWLFAFLSISAYALVVAFGSSERAPLVIISLAILSTGFFIGAVEDFLQQKAFPWAKIVQAGIGLLCLLALAWFARLDLDLISSSKAQDENIRGLAEILLKAGMKSPDEVFTDSFAVYFPDLPPYTPRAFGGWNDDYLWNYTKIYPKLPFDSASAFQKACQEQGIRFLILTPKSADSAGFLYALYTDGKANGLSTFELVRKFGNFRVFKRSEVP